MAWCSRSNLISPQLGSTHGCEFRGTVDAIEIEGDKIVQILDFYFENLYDRELRVCEESECDLTRSAWTDSRKPPSTS